MKHKNYFLILSLTLLSLITLCQSGNLLLIENSTNNDIFVPTKISPVQNDSNPLCKKWNGSICLQCSTRAFFNKYSICEEVNPNCNTWDKQNGDCLSCYQGFLLEKGDCIESNDTSQMDPLCRKFDFQKKVCTECAERSFKNAQGVCTEVPPLCKTSNQLNCTSCYGGYKLKNGKCIAINQNQSPNPATMDQGCTKWDWANQKCLKCSTRFYFNIQGVCTQVSDTCNTYNSATGACTSCYSGYSLNGTECVLSQGNNNKTNPNPNSSDPNCRNYDSQSGRCLQCSYRFYLSSNGVCAQVSDQCQTWNYSNGLCTSCYQGYQLNQGACVEGSNDYSGQDPNCAQFDQAQKRCIKCSTRFYLNQNDICTAVSSQCQTWDNTTGQCTSCYQGYTLSNGGCNPFQQNNTIPEGCSSYNSQTNTCQSCDKNYCLSQNNLCIQKPQNCQICEYRGGCVKCNDGYQLSGGQCVQNSNSRCLQYQGSQCVQCQQNSFLYNGYCITYDELRKILDLYFANNSGNSGQGSPTSQNQSAQNTPNLSINSNTQTPPLY